MKRSDNEQTKQALHGIWQKLASLPVLLLVMAGVVLVIAGLYMRLVFGEFVPTPPAGGQEWGTFGDAFGGLNAIYSGLAFAGVIVSLIYQRRELSHQIEELQKTSNALEEQRKEMQRQRLLQHTPLITIDDVRLSFNLVRYMKDDDPVFPIDIEITLQNASAATAINIEIDAEVRMKGQIISKKNLPIHVWGANKVDKTIFLFGIRPGSFRSLVSNLQNGATLLLGVRFQNHDFVEWHVAGNEFVFDFPLVPDGLDQLGLGPTLESHLAAIATAYEKGDQSYISNYCNEIKREGESPYREPFKTTIQSRRFPRHLSISGPSFKRVSGME